MRVFVTGATGFIGAALVRELLHAGHQVLGLARSEAGAQSLEHAGAQVHRGDLSDLATLRDGVAATEAVIHLAFNHDFSQFQQNCESDRRIIGVLGEALAGSNRPLIVTSGTGLAGGKSGRLITEEDPPVSSQLIPRAASEEAAAAAAARGVRVVTVRLPQVHDTLKQGLVTYLIQVARETGVSAYVGEGANRWPAAHRLDVAQLYRLALEKGESGARYHAVAEEGVSLRKIAQAVGDGLRLPVVSVAPKDAAAHFGWLGMFAGEDLAASSARTRERLGWTPRGPGLIADLRNMHY